jgi:hypothetical protein
MTKYLVEFKRDTPQFNSYYHADDAPQLLHRLGEEKVLHLVFNIWEMREVEFDTGYYQDTENQ